MKNTENMEHYNGTEEDGTRDAGRTCKNKNEEDGTRDAGRACKNRNEEEEQEGRQRFRDRSRVREKEYFSMLRRELESRRGENVEISFREVRKNNGVYRKACTVRFDEAQVAPTVYLDAYYDHFLHGEGVAESADNILNYCRRRTPDISFPDSFFRDYTTVRGRLGIKLIGTKRNRLFLADVPHVEKEDMSAIFFYLMENPAFGNGMIIIRNPDMERWGMTVEQLYQDAIENCPKILPPVFRALSEVLHVVRPFGESEMYLLTNKSALYGAAVTLYPGILQEIADFLGKDYFVLPSSVHEVILLPDCGEDPEGLLEIVSDINHTQVMEEEILTDAVYHFTSGSEYLEKQA